MILLKNLNKWGGVILLLAMFVMFNSEARAGVKKTVIISVGGCQYSVDIDYACNPPGPGTMFWSVEEIRKIDSNCVGTLSPSEVPYAISMEIRNNLDYYLWECTASGIAPCSLGQTKVKSIEYTCWTLWGGVTLTACGNSKQCVTITEYCFDGTDLIEGSSTTTGAPSTPQECSDLNFCDGAEPVDTSCD